METLNKLIADASAIAGSEYQVAKILGIPQSHISEWKAGRRSCVPADRARLAGIARQDAVQELVRATLESTEGTKRGEQLQQLLGKLLRPTGVVHGLVAAGLVSLISLSDPTGRAIQYVLGRNRRTQQALCQAFSA